jgi:hypothetical protein
MKRVRGNIIIVTLSYLSLLVALSCESTSNSDQTPVVRLELSVEHAGGTAPDTVTFDGTLYGDIDMLRISYPQEFSFCPGTSPKGVCIVYYPPCDTTQSAKRSYLKTFIYEQPGTYKASMLVHCCNRGVTLRDTVVVQVE